MKPALGSTREEWWRTRRPFLFREYVAAWGLILIAAYAERFSGDASSTSLVAVAAVIGFMNTLWAGAERAWRRRSVQPLLISLALVAIGVVAVGWQWRRPTPSWDAVGFCLAGWSTFKAGEIAIGYAWRRRTRGVRIDPFP